MSAVDVFLTTVYTVEIAGTCALCVWILVKLAQVIREDEDEK